MCVGRKEPYGCPESDDSRCPPGKVESLRARPGIHQLPPALGIALYPGLKFEDCSFFVGKMF